MQDSSRQESLFIKMTQRPVKRLILSLSVPTIVSMMISSIYNMADTYFVGRLGTSATGAVGIVFSLMVIIQAVGFTFGVGAGSLISRLLGQKRNQEADSVAVTALLMSVGLGFIIMAIGLIFVQDIMRVLGATETILPYAVDYAEFILIGAPYMTASLVMNNILRSEGSATLSMVGIAVGGVLNIILDPIFIFTLDMGMKGAALATLISQFVSFCILLSMLLSKRSSISLKLKNFTLKPQVHMEILKIGSPSFFRQILASIASVCLNTFAGPFGDYAIAAMSVVSRIMFFMVSALLGFGQAFTPVAGYNYGAKRYDRLWDSYWFCIWFSAAVVSFMGIVAFIFAENIVTLFRKDDLDVILTGTIALRAQCITLPLQAFVITSNMLFQATGRAVKAAVLALARQGLFFIPLIFILSKTLGLTGVQISQAAADLCTFIIAVPVVYSFMKEIKTLKDGMADIEGLEEMRLAGDGAAVKSQG
ncbi:MAG: MATE family efflux transporter [Christensenellales bacterium]